MKFAACLHLLLAFVPATFGFTAVSKRHQSHVNTLMASPDDVETGISRRYFASSIGAFAVGSFALSREASGFDDSTLALADEIKTLDFSLPSYDAIANSKASIETVDGLAEKYVPEEAPRGMSRKTQKKEPKADSGGSNPMAAVLPSMKKSNEKKSKPKPAPRASPKEGQDEKPLGVETLDLSLPSYSSSSGKEKSIFSI